MFKMVNKGAFYVLACFLAAGMMMWGCDLSGKDSAEGPAGSGIEGLSFVEGSSGLPDTGQWRQGLAFHDMNDDGHVDIVATPRRAAPVDETAVPVVWYGDGKGAWTKDALEVPGNLPYDYGAVEVADFDGDGIADIAIAMHGLGLRVLKGTKEGAFVSFSKGLPSTSEFATRALVTADLNHDGVTDIAAFREYLDPQSGVPAYGGLVWCALEGDTWKCQGIGDKVKTLALMGDQIVAGDVDGDGNQDLAVSSFNHRITKIVWLGDGKGGFTPFNTGLMKEKHYNSVSLADVDADGRDDLVASVSSFGEEFKGVKAYISRPDGFVDMSEGIPSDDETWGYFASTGDLNGDGVPEIIAAPKAGGLRVYAMKDNTWHEMKVSGLPDKGLYRLYNIYCTDINQDAQNDIVVIYADATDDSGGIRVFLNASQKK